MSSPKRNVAYEFDIALVDSSDTGSFLANPTIAAGDFKVSTDNGALGNLSTLPVVDPAGSIIVKINLSAAEMNGDKIMVQCIDAAGNEWDDVLIFIEATVDIDVDGNVDDTTPLAGDFDGNSGLEATIDDFYKSQYVIFTTGSLRGTARKISVYTAATRRFQFTGAAGSADIPFPEAPADTDKFKILGMHGT